ARVPVSMVAGAGRNRFEAQHEAALAFFQGPGAGHPRPPSLGTPVWSKGRAWSCGPSFHGVQSAQATSVHTPSPPQVWVVRVEAAPRSPDSVAALRQGRDREAAIRRKEDPPTVLLSSPGV
ncbi:MAG: hypothetical protein LQ340_006524, partial [Diploschistes diacapsis]